MIKSLLLASLAAGPFSMPASPPEAELAIRSITVRPEEPVVGAYDSIRLVIDVVAKGARGKDGVTVKVEPGAPPGPVLADKVTEEATRRPQEPSPAPSPPAAPEPSVEVTPAPDAGAARLAPSRPLWQAMGPVQAPRANDGWETWRFLPDKRLNRYYPTGTWTITATAKGAHGATVTEYASFQLRRATRITSVTAEEAGRSGAVRLSGSLRRVDPRGYTGYGPFAKQPLEILWRLDDSSPWEKAGQTTTDASGAFETTVTGRTGGFWRVRYLGTGHYAPDISKSQQITQ
ncbi:hypothetical protein [Nonomuraea sp. NPDC050786]|uniref:hypothetical protein n=1 Tax=Nonomuraea sp. NPDC050786 TaxID=3154840 RepID=UPI0033C62730